jgi:hypothetical protein
MMRPKSSGDADAPQQCSRVLYSVSIAVVIEIRPYTARAARPDFFRPHAIFCQAGKVGANVICSGCCLTGAAPFMLRFEITRFAGAFSQIG